MIKLPHPHPMDQGLPYHLADPDVLSCGAVFDSPHSGSAYPDALVARSRLDPLRLRASEDAFVDQLFGIVPSYGAPLLSAVLPRAWLDLNRGPRELDPALIDGARSVGINQRIAAGLGVVPRIVADATTIYDGKLTLAEAEARIRDVHVPYHAQLEMLMTRARGHFGTALLFDCHSMPSEALRAAPRIRGRAPEVVLGDRFGASASREITRLTQEAFERQGFLVTRNAPFAGGYIVQRYGRPGRSMHAVQIEIDRGLYLDQTRIEPNADFDDVRARIALVVAELVTLAPGLSALAAE